MTATATAPKTATRPPATDAIELVLASFGGERYCAVPWAPGVSVRGATGDPKPCFAVNFLLPKPETYHEQANAAARACVARFAAIRDTFKLNQKWLDVLALEARITAMAAETQAALDRAEKAKVKVKAAIVAFDRAAEATASAAVKAAETEAAESESRVAIVRGLLPGVRGSAIAALRGLLEAERDEQHRAAVEEAQRLADALTKAVALLAGRLTCVNVVAGITNQRGAGDFGGPTGGVVDEFAARLPH